MTTSKKNIIALCLSLALVSCQKATEQTSFLLLGDIHYDKIENHDLAWLATTKDDLRQVTTEYTQWTANNWDGFAANFMRVIDSLSPSIKAVAQMGDLSEGLAGTPALAEQMAECVFEMWDSLGIAIPTVVTKGNHDITGPGAVEAFDKIYLPNMARLAGVDSLSSANYAVQVDDDVLFVCFDPWDRKGDNLDKLAANLASSDARYKFVLVHEPIIPINERCWHILRRDNDRRERLLEIIAKEQAIVLCAHMHLYSVVRRDTPWGPIVQILVNSVIRDPQMLEPRNIITEYGPSLATNVPDWEPETLDQRVAWLEAETPHVKYFKVMDLPGFGILSIDKATDRILLDYYAGYGKTPYETTDISEIINLK